MVSAVNAGVTLAKKFVILKKHLGGGGTDEEDEEEKGEGEVQSYTLHENSETVGAVTQAQQLMSDILTSQMMIEQNDHLRGRMEHLSEIVIIRVRAHRKSSGMTWNCANYVLNSESTLTHFWLASSRLFVWSCSSCSVPRQGSVEWSPQRRPVGEGHGHTQVTRNRIAICACTCSNMQPRTRTTLRTTQADRRSSGKEC